ncbi:protein CASP isoform X3 [Pan troglodytes]|uniref:protein CASP isoform X3 n=1 Tax=Pan troglodytes TaxID=9598 RepID=UPI0023F2628B|nr:protein CASP isoform X3 [Pan troglodytes]
MLPVQPAELLAWKSPRATGKDINKHQEVSKSTRSHRHHVDVHLPVFPGKILLNCAALTKRGCCAELQVRITEAVATATEQREMITRLEQDLSIIQSIQWPDAEGAAEHRLEKIPEPIKEATALFYGPAAPASGALPEGQVDSLLSIISSQRERFCARNQELEAGSGSDDTELRYSSQYEERLDPFSSFSKRERQRKYLSLSPWDKATLSMGRLVLSNKMARTIGFFYTLFLHCLVFLVLYKLAWSESMERDCATFCAKKFTDHLHKFHENDNGAAAGDLWQ